MKSDNNPKPSAGLKTDNDCIAEANVKYEYPPLRDEHVPPTKNTYQKNNPNNAKDGKDSGKEANTSLQINKDRAVSYSDSEQNTRSSTNTPNTTLPEDTDTGKDCLQLVATFPQQLMDAIEQETKDGAMIDGERVLEWLPTGDAFFIRDKASLEKDVLPRYFSTKCKFMSFVRKLYRWGFHQVEKSPTRAMIFMHTHFVRGDKKRCLMMRSIVKKPAAQQQARAFIDVADVAVRGHFPTTNMLQEFDSNSQYSMGGFMPNPFSQGVTSTDMFEAGLCLERIEQRQQQRQFSPALPPPPLPMELNSNNSDFGGNMAQLELATQILKQEPGMEYWRALELAKNLQK